MPALAGIRARDGDYAAASSKLNAWPAQSRRCETARNFLPERQCKSSPTLQLPDSPRIEGIVRAQVPGRPATACTRQTWLLKNRDVRRTFDSLDFFYDDEQATSYATVWGLIWVDSRP